MNKLLCLAILSTAACLCLPGAATAAEPASPDYLLLRTPQVNTPQKPTHGFYPGRGYGVTTNAYAYGWFGAAPRRHHWSRHFGYYRNYTQWSKR